MDTQFEWREEYSIGVDSIDQEHKRLFRIINKLFDFKEEEKDNQWTCQEGIKYFKGHAVKHFADEEAYMASIGYEGLEQHRRIHQDFRKNILPALEQELEQTGGNGAFPGRVRRMAGGPYPHRGPGHYRREDEHM